MLTWTGTELGDELQDEVDAAYLVVRNELDVDRVGRHLAQLVEWHVRPDGDRHDLDAGVLHDVGLDDGSRQVVGAALDEQQDRVERRWTRVRRQQLHVRHLQALPSASQRISHHAVTLVTKLDEQ